MSNAVRTHRATDPNAATAYAHGNRQPHTTPTNEAANGVPNVARWEMASVAKSDPRVAANPMKNTMTGIASPTNRELPNRTGRRQAAATSAPCSRHNVAKVQPYGMSMICTVARRGIAPDRDTLMGIFLGLASGISWGFADFFGGFASRRMNPAAVAFVSQVVGTVGVLIAVLIMRPGATAWTPPKYML